MLRGGHTEALWSPVRTAVLQQNVAKSLHNMKLPIVLQFFKNVMMSVQLLVQAVGVKLLKVMSNERMVF
jgi:hypothetical protein